jgi:glycogen debranching enzyme
MTATQQDGPPRPDTDATLTGPFYIQASSPAADELARVLKHGDTFGVFDHYGDIQPGGLGEEGLYHEGTRFLSRLLLLLERERPLFLSSTVKEDNEFLTVDLTNPDLFRDGKVAVPRGTLHLARRKFLWGGACYERLRVRNYGLAPLLITLAVSYAVDFADIFEVRGVKRQRRGRLLEPNAEAGRITLAYEGLDAVIRRTRLSFTPTPDLLTSGQAVFALKLAPQQEVVLELIISCQRGDESRQVVSFKDAREAASREQEVVRRQASSVHTSNEPFNTLLRRTAADMHMLTTQTGLGPYPYGGVPWFCTPFGRDGILTALESLWIDPALARGVLAFLAATQADTLDPAQDAEPGKILHEMRCGEMAALREIPFGRYYGSIDATPLFVFLAGAWYDRTGELEFLRKLWPNIRRALDWIDNYGDPDGDGFVEYQRHSPNGLDQQGWKDSHDSVFHADGTLAPPPIALCEVQAYVYGAWQAAARLARALGHTVESDKLAARAERLRQKFAEAFWLPELGTFALALDGHKRPCRVRTSNAGQCLLTGIAHSEHASRIAQWLMEPESFSGWGVRTVAAGEARFNPMSYHNGSVWPHDNALIADGLARYGHKDAVCRILTGMFQASLFLDLNRLPELFCGFPRRTGEGPTLYPVACAPQAWSAASVFLLLRACLGLEIDGVKGELNFCYPVLPDYLRELHIHNLCVQDSSVDLLLLRHGNDVGINVVRKQGSLRVLMVK